MAENSQRLETARTRGTAWGREAASLLIPLICADGSLDVFRGGLKDVRRELEALASELAAREGQAVAVTWREAAVAALRAELVAFDALAEEATASVR
jgi:polysaccharide deacetylase 2 family uncharacterized protein YibQ